MKSLENVLGYCTALLKELLVICFASAIVLLGAAAFVRIKSTPVSAPVASAQHPVRIGMNITVQNVAFVKHNLSFVLVTNPTCRYCIKSAPFHKRLNSAATAHGIPLYAIVPDIKHARELLQTLGVKEVSTRAWASMNVSVSGTPTLLAVSRIGTVERIWIGSVPDEVERDILSLTEHPEISRLPVPPPADERHVKIPNYSTSELQKIQMTQHVRVIDPDERHGAESVDRDKISIPLRELMIRARFELNIKDLQVVDCTSGREGTCLKAAEMLSGMGFYVATHGLGSFYQSCSTSITSTSE
jgi:hypothetical protein